MIQAADTADVTIERIFLWDEVSNLFKVHALLTGLQMSFDDETQNNIVLAGDLYDDEQTIQVEMWARWIGGIGIHQATIVFNYPNTHGNDFEYEITAHYLREYALEPTPLDQEDIQDLRVDLSETAWDAKKSAEAAANKILFSV